MGWGECIVNYFQEKANGADIEFTLNRLSSYHRGEWTVSNGVSFKLHPNRMAYAWVVRDGTRMDMWETNSGYLVSDPLLKQWLYEGVALLDQELKEQSQRWAAERAQTEKEFAAI